MYCIQVLEVPNTDRKVEINCCKLLKIKIVISEEKQKKNTGKVVKFQIRFMAATFGL